MGSDPAILRRPALIEVGIVGILVAIGHPPSLCPAAEPLPRLVDSAHYR